MKKIIFYALLLSAGTAMFSCHKIKQADPSDDQVPLRELTLVAESDKQWTGITMSAENRLFVNYPNWSPDHTISVADITDTSMAVPYPDAAWNTWNNTLDPAEHFICVQSVFVDADNFLWVLDAANPQRNGEYLGVVDGGAKLVKINLATNTVLKTIVFDKPVIKDNSYLNDVRIDEGRQIGYITDSNEGAIVVVDLSAGTARRALSDQPVTKSENRIITVEGSEWRNQQGEYPVVHSDGIALSQDEEYLYWRALTAESLYRIQTSLLRDATVSDSVLNATAERVGRYRPSDGILFGKDGRIYLTSMEENGVRVLNGPNSELIVQSEDLKWPDALYNGPDGYIYVSSSQLHIPHPSKPYRIFKFRQQ